jgi:hypothetical protein
MTAPCIGYALTPGSKHLWERCTNPSKRGDRYCAPHREALDGAILGLLQWEHRLYGPTTKNEDCLIPSDGYVCDSCGARWEWRVPGRTEPRGHGNRRSRRVSGFRAAAAPKKEQAKKVKGAYPDSKTSPAQKALKIVPLGDEIAIASPPPHNGILPGR